MRVDCVADKFFVFLMGCLIAAVSVAAQPGVVVLPERVELEGNFARGRLLVGLREEGERGREGEGEDLTTTARYASSDEAIVKVDGAGQMLAVGDGEAKIVVEVDGARVEVPVKVSGVVAEPVVSFSESIRP